MAHTPCTVSFVEVAFMLWVTILPAMAGSFGTIEKADFAANVAVDAGES